MQIRGSITLSLVAMALAAPSFAEEAGVLTLAERRLNTHDGRQYQAEFGSFTVPENRSDPQSNIISLGIMRVKSLNPDAGPPIFILAGGPGGSSILNLQEAVFHDRNEPDFEYALAQVSSRGERYKEAAKAYERFLRIAPDNDTERRDRIRGLIKFLNFLGRRSGIYQLAGESTTSVETKIVNNRPVVPVRFEKNGEVLDFVLDTGSGITVISEETALEASNNPDQLKMNLKGIFLGDDRKIVN